MKQLRKKGFKVRDEVHIATFILDDMEMTNRVDLLINDKVIVDCKHVSKLKHENQQQLRDYMDLPKLRKNHRILISFPKNCDPVTLPAEIGCRMPGFQAGKSRVHFEEIAVSASMFSQRAAARLHRDNKFRFAGGLTWALLLLLVVCMCIIVQVGNCAVIQTLSKPHKAV